MRPHSILLPVTLALALAAACGGGGNPDASPPAAIEHPEGGSELVVRVASGGGLIPEQVRAAEIPGWSLYGDGTLITTGPQIEIYPQPALPNLLRRSISEEGVQAILHAAFEAGLLETDRRLAATDATDLWTTTITVNAGGKTHTTSVYGLGFRPPEGVTVPTPKDADTIASIQAFWDKTSDLARLLPQGSIGPEKPYRFEEMRVFAFPYQKPTDPELKQTEVPWPLEEGPQGEPTDAGVSCLAVSGSNLDALLPLAEDANQLTPWVTDPESRHSKAYQLVFRPLLPDESGC